MDIAAVAIGPRKIHINWGPPLSWRQNGIIWSYLAVAETKEHTNLTSYSTSLTAESLHPYYSYNITVAAVPLEWVLSVQKVHLKPLKMVSEW